MVDYGKNKEKIKQKNANKKFVPIGTYRIVFYNFYLQGFMTFMSGKLVEHILKLKMKPNGANLLHYIQCYHAVIAMRSIAI